MLKHEESEICITIPPHYVNALTPELHGYNLNYHRELQQSVNA